MALMNAIERRGWRGRAVVAAVYLVLMLGAFTMVYPFGLMLGGSMRGNTDLREKNLVPGFITNHERLWARFAEAMMNERLQTANITYGGRWRDFAAIPRPVSNKERLADWRCFLDGVEASFPDGAPPWMYTAGFSSAPLTKTVPSHLRGFRGWLRGRYPAVDDLNAALGTALENWDGVVLANESYLGRREAVSHDGLMAEWVRFKQGLDPGLRVWMSLENYYRWGFLAVRYGSIDTYNKQWQTAFAGFGDIPLSRSVPDPPDEWEVFVREIAGLQWLTYSETTAETFRLFLRARYMDNPARLNDAWQTAYGGFDEIPMPGTADTHALPDLALFVRGWRDAGGTLWQAPAGGLGLNTLDDAWRGFLRKRYGSLGNLNAAWRATHASFDEIPMPQHEAHAALLAAAPNRWRWEFVTRNYRTVLDHIAIHGRGVRNTIIYCFWAVLGALIVNPLAAYALSRYPIRKGYRVMLFCLCTMAFPPMVTQIPGFLMLRGFNMLNTFWALILPGLANGYSIFLLKGFFDSQPRELYEAAALDGAGEWRIFWSLAMNLSKPILAVVGLNAFTLAYSNFMFAFVVCQDESMWTLMVWLYQLQQNSGQAVMYASLVIAALPTLCVFLFCQRLILRGIVVPVEK